MYYSLGFHRQNASNWGSAVIVWWPMMQFHFWNGFHCKTENVHCNLHRPEISRQYVWMILSHCISFKIPFDLFSRPSVGGKNKQRWKSLIFSQEAGSDSVYFQDKCILPLTPSLIKIKHSLLIFLWFLIKYLYFLLVKSKRNFSFFE